MDELRGSRVNFGVMIVDINKIVSREQVKWKFSTLERFLCWQFDLLGIKIYSTELVYRGVWVVNRMTLGIYKNTPNYLLPL